MSAAGLLVVGHCIGTLVQQPLDLQWLFLALLTLFSGAFTIRIPSVAARLSVSETFVFASVLLFGTCAGTVTVAVEILVIIIAGSRKRRRDPLRVLFNVSSAALSIWIAGHAFYYIAGIPPLRQHDPDLQTLILPLAVLSVTYFLLNSGMVAVALALHKSESALDIWRANFLALAVNYVGGASLAALFVSYTRTIDFGALGVIIPLLVISYLSFRYSFSRIESATQHVEEIKRLYLSTIETLATAIDAKDQVTHGHIRRVQQFALGLARELGVRDLGQLQALEAAALLHDTGKLVVPEHILNKPGKLTRGEYEKMKAHASVGAEILSSISFPYPVVPIVRHHHESWDGSGYPDGLSGTDIPIGARILAVVDCFDALTSDRPYRPRMSDTDAIAVLLQRRAVMYDPLVVDVFVSTWQKLAAEIEEPKRNSENSMAHASGVHRMNEVVETINQNWVEPLNALLQSSLRVTGGDLAVLFGSDQERDELVSLVAGTTTGQISDPISMPLGAGVSGWVAVNESAIVNADAALDFPNDTRWSEYVRSICVPVFVKHHVVGVLAIYSKDRRGFSEADKTLLEKLAASLDSDSPSRSIELLLQSKRVSTPPSQTIH